MVAVFKGKACLIEALLHSGPDNTQTLLHVLPGWPHSTVSVLENEL